MITPQSTPARVFRAALVAWSVSALAVVAHVAADGMAPPVLAVILVAMATAGVALALSKRQLSSLNLVCLIGSAQVAVHLLGSYLTGPAHHAVPALDAELMIGAHALSTVATALLLAHGERVWWLLVAWLGGWQAVLLHGRPQVRVVRLVTQHIQISGRNTLRFCVVLRGPPFVAQF